MNNNYFSTIYPIKKKLKENGCNDCKYGYNGYASYIIKCETCRWNDHILICNKNNCKKCKFIYDECCS